MIITTDSSNTNARNPADRLFTIEHVSFTRLDEKGDVISVRFLKQHPYLMLKLMAMGAGVMFFFGLLLALPPKPANLEPLTAISIIPFTSGALMLLAGVYDCSCRLDMVVDKPRETITIKWTIFWHVHFSETVIACKDIKSIEEKATTFKYYGQDWNTHQITIFRIAIMTACETVFLESSQNMEHAGRLKLIRVLNKVMGLPVVD